MANEVDICNLALSRVGAASAIESLDEISPGAVSCKIHYPFARDAVLRDHDWGFARKIETLSVLTEEWDGWDYVYAYPSGCLAAREIYNAAKVAPQDLIPFEVGLAASGDRKLILTDEEQAKLIYTFRVTNATMFDTLFVEALSWKLAADIVQPLKGKGESGLQAQYLKMYEQTVAKAKISSANEFFTQPSLENDLVRSRA